MSATAKFYTGFFIALAMIVAASFAIGHHYGERKRTTVGQSQSAESLARFKVCLIDAKRRTTAMPIIPVQKLAQFALLEQDCAKISDVARLTARDLYDMTGVRITGLVTNSFNDPAWTHPDVVRRAPFRGEGPILK